VALMMASIAGIIMFSGGVVALGIGLFLIVNAFLVLGALVWA